MKKIKSMPALKYLMELRKRKHVLPTCISVRRISILMQVADNQEQEKSNRNIPKFLVLKRLSLPYFSRANRSSNVITNVTHSILYTSSLTQETDYSLSILSKLMSQWMASYTKVHYIHQTQYYWHTGFS